MAKLFFLAIASTLVSSTAATARLTGPWCIPRGGEGVSTSATSIPAGGSESDYAVRLEAVKSRVLVAASESVRNYVIDPAPYRVMFLIDCCVKKYVN